MPTELKQVYVHPTIKKVIVRMSEGLDPKLSQMDLIAALVLESLGPNGLRDLEGLDSLERSFLDYSYRRLILAGE